MSTAPLLAVAEPMESIVDDNSNSVAHSAAINSMSKTALAIHSAACYLVLSVVKLQRQSDNQLRAANNNGIRIVNCVHKSFPQTLHNTRKLTLVCSKLPKLALLAFLFNFKWK